MEILLESKAYEVEKINRKSNAAMFKDLKVGDRIGFSVPLEAAGRNGSTYATYITTVNTWNGDKNISSFNQLPKILEAFELKEVKI